MILEKKRVGMLEVSFKVTNMEWSGGRKVCRRAGDAIEALEL